MILADIKGFYEFVDDGNFEEGTGRLDVHACFGYIDIIGFYGHVSPFIAFPVHGQVLIFGQAVSILPLGILGYGHPRE